MSSMQVGLGLRPTYAIQPTKRSEHQTTRNHMRQDKNSFRHDSLQDAKSISKILGSITNGISNGKLVFHDGDDKIIMKPDGLLEFKVTASQEDDRQRVNLRISWQVENKKKHRAKQLTVSS